MGPITSQGGVQGWSQIRENLLNQQGAVKERTVDGQTQLYVSDKFSNPFKDKTEHTSKLSGGMAAVRQALVNEYGSTFADMAFEKLNASRPFASMRSPMTSLSGGDLQKLDRMTQAADRFAARSLTDESTHFLREVTGFRSKGPDQAAAAFAGLYNRFIREGAPEQVNIDYGSRTAIERLLAETRDGASPEQVQAMTRLIGEAADEIRALINNDSMTRFHHSDDWRRA